MYLIHYIFVRYTRACSIFRYLLTRSHGTRFYTFVNTERLVVSTAISLYTTLCCSGLVHYCSGYHCQLLIQISLLYGVKFATCIVVRCSIFRYLLTRSHGTPFYTFVNTERLVVSTAISLILCNLNVSLELLVYSAAIIFNGYCCTTELNSLHCCTELNSLQV